MRVFYEYEDEEEKGEEEKRQYYVKIDNISVPDQLKGFKAIKASTTEELIKKIKEYYNFNKSSDVSIQLWSNSNFTGKRLDNLDTIPKENEFLWVRGINKNQ